MTDGPLLWYLNRSTGLVLLVLLTLTLVLGVVATRGDRAPGRRTRVPRFVTQSLHRNLGLLATTLLVVHVATAVLDEYVDIRWWQSALPWHLHYRPFWLALGILALDLMLAAVATSLVRERIGPRVWLAIHLTTYPVWALALAHGLGIGTDTGAGWARGVYVGCGVAVVLAGALRLLGRRRTTAATTTPAPTVEVDEPSTVSGWLR